MFQRRTYLASLLVVFLSACGSGGGSSADSTTAPATFTASAIVADCAGAACSATAGTLPSYAGTGTGVWRFDNTSSRAVVGDVVIQNVTAGKTVSLIYTNPSLGTNAPSLPNLGALASLASTDIESHVAQHGHIRGQNRLVTLGMDKESLNAPSQASGLSKYSAEGYPSTPLPVVAIGDTRVWNENGFTKLDYTTTAQRMCPAGVLGRKVVIWVQTTAYPSVVTDAQLNAYQSHFCGTNNNDGAYAKVANAIGDVWGAAVPTQYSTTRIADLTGQKQDINIVIVSPVSTLNWGGYFYSLNNRLKTTPPVRDAGGNILVDYTKSNESLVFFVKSGQSQNYIQSVLIHELTHMINYYQRTVLNDDIYEDWLEETTAMMTQDIFDPGLVLSGNCLPIVCQLQSYATSGAGISYFDWPTDTISYNHYYMGAAFGAFLNRRYGPHIYLQLTTDCYTAPANTSGYTCLDMLIKNNGGVGIADELVRFGASVFGRMGGTGEPSSFGFPAKAGVTTLKTTHGAGAVSATFAYSIPAINHWWTYLYLPTATPLTTFPYSSHTYQIETVAQGKTSYVRTGVSIPAKTTLSVVVK
jgi:Peptidase M30